MKDTIMMLIPIVVAHATVLVVIIIVIKKLLMGDTLNAVSRIKQVETEVRKKEEAIRKEIEEHEKEFEKQKSDAEEELRKRREVMEKELGLTKDQVVAEARKEADNIVSQARKNEEKIKQQIMQDMEEKAVGYGGEIFKLVFSEKINAELNKHFIGELLDALQEVDGSSITIDTSKIEFTSSHPIDPEQKQRLEKLLAEKFGVQIKVEEKVREDLLGGLILKLGSLEIDGSLLNRFKEAAVEVKKTAHI